MTNVNTPIEYILIKPTIYAHNMGLIIYELNYKLNKV